MSYDIYVQAPRCAECNHTPESTYWNYTSNMAPAWRAAGADLATFDGKRAGECEPVLASAIALMEAEPERFAEFDAPNGWGSLETLIPALKELLEDFRSRPHGIVKVWR